MQEKKYYNIKDMYEWYIKDVVKGSVYDIPSSLYEELCYSYFKELRDDILNGKMVTLPYRLGTIAVTKYKAKLYKERLVGVDYVLTKKYGKKILFTNEHTSGYMYKFKWSKINAIVKNKHCYQFKASRDNKRTLAKLIKQDHVDYMELSR